MPSLAKLQQQFQAYIHDDRQRDIHRAIVDDVIVGADKRLSIYFNAYRYRLIETLATQYPKLAEHLGNKLFQEYAQAYIELNPSSCQNLRNYGDTFGQHLKQAAPNHPELAEIATFEWLLGLAFDAYNKPAITLDVLAEIPADRWGELFFEFHPAVTSMETHWNSIEIWQAVQQTNTPPKPQKYQKSLTWVIWRSNIDGDLDANYRSLSATESLAFRLAYKDQVDFATLCQTLAESATLDNSTDEAVSMQAAKYLAQWINEGFITNIHFSQ